VYSRDGATPSSRQVAWAIVPKAQWITPHVGLERNEWTVSIHPADIESPRRVVTGAREVAELLARSMIDKWYQGRGANRREVR
jgi:hypothetical protein